MMMIHGGGFQAQRPNNFYLFYGTQLLNNYNFMSNAEA